MIAARGVANAGINRGFQPRLQQMQVPNVPDAARNQSTNKEQTSMDLEALKEADATSVQISDFTLDCNHSVHKANSPTLMSLYRHGTWQHQATLKQYGADQNFAPAGVDVLGSGTFGFTVVAIQVETGKPCALKFMTPKHRFDSARRCQFRDEALMLHKITQAQTKESICVVPDFVGFGWADVGGGLGSPFIAMNLCAFTLARLRDGNVAKLKSDSTVAGPSQMMGWHSRALIAHKLAEGLAFLHKNGVLHADFKHDNLWWNNSAEAGVLDLGCYLDVDSNGRALSRLHKLPLRYWLPPEVAETDLHKQKGVEFVSVTSALDWFGFGAFLISHFYMVPRSAKDHSMRNVEKHILPEIFKSHLHHNLVLHHGVDIATRVYSLVSSLLHTNPLLRPKEGVTLRVLKALVDATNRKRGKKRTRGRGGEGGGVGGGRGYAPPNLPHVAGDTISTDGANSDMRDSGGAGAS
jgi:hypothetical protein